MAETQAAKVDRYIAEDRVSKQLELPDGGSVWRINGDGGTYRFNVDAEGVEWQCTCPAALRGRKDCSHAWMVLRIMGLDPPAPLEVVHLDTPVENIDAMVLDEEPDDTAPIGAPVLVPDIEERRDLIALAKAPVTWQTIVMIQDTDFVPGALRHKPYAILAAMLLGRDWGLGEIESLRMIDVIDGRPAPSAEMCLRLYRRAGHMIEVHQADSTAVTLTGKRSDTGETLKVSYSLEDAAGAGLITLGDNQKVVARSARGNPMPWELHTAEMLWARAVTRLVRRLAPDCMDQP